MNNRTSMAAGKLVFVIAIACVIAWLVYFIVLFLLDYLLGAHQLSHHLLLGSVGRLLRQILATIVDSAWLTAPIVAIYTLILFWISRSRYRLRMILAIAAGASLLLASLLSLRIPPLQTVPFVAAFTVSMLFVRMVFCDKGKAQ